MTQTVWYHAGYDHLLVRIDRDYVEAGEQRSSTLVHDGNIISVPDYLNLFKWRVNRNKWKSHIKKGWLIKVGTL